MNWAEFHTYGNKNYPFNNFCIDIVKCNLIGLHYFHWPMKTHGTWLRRHESKTPIKSHGLTTTKYMHYGGFYITRKLHCHCHSQIILYLGLALPLLLITTCRTQAAKQWKWILFPQTLDSLKAYWKILFAAFCIDLSWTLHVIGSVFGTLC